MTDFQTSRTLVKSAPELWAECSDAASLARHLGTFGEIRITKLEPESTVAWEGAAASGTVRLEPSGWGTRVTLTVTEEVPEVEEPPEVEEALGVEEPLGMEEALGVEEAPPPALVQDGAAAPPRPGWFARWRARWRRQPLPPPAVEPEPDPAAAAVEAGMAAPAAGVAAPTAGVAAPTADRADPSDSPPPPGEQALAAALDSLGRAHHRPYSRV